MHDRKKDRTVSYEQNKFLSYLMNINTYQSNL